MTIATESETQQLIDRFGLYDPSRDFTADDPDMGLCYSLATINALIITARNIREGKFNATPNIMSVHLPDMEDDHAYLVYESKVYNYRVTFPTNRYPDIDTDGLMERGAQDFTKVLALNALSAYQGGEDLYALGFVRAIPENFDIDPDIFLLAFRILLGR